MSQSRHHPLDVETVDGVVVVKLTTTTLDESNLHAVGEQLLRLVDEPGRHKLHLDLESVQYIASMGLAKFIALHKKLQTMGGHLTLCNVGASVYEVFQVTRLNTLLDVRQKEVA